MKISRIIILVIGILTYEFCNAQTWQLYRDSTLTVLKQLEKSVGKNADYAKNLEDLGRLYFTNDILNAEPFFLESKNIREKLFTRESREYANSVNALGNLHSELGNLVLSEKYHLESLGIRGKVLGKTDLQYATSLNNLGNLYRTLGRYNEAEEYVLAAKKIREKARPEVYAITVTNLANLYRDMGQYEKAEQYYMQAREIRRKIAPVGESDDYMASTSILADLYAFMGKNQLAEDLYQETKLLYNKAERMNEYAQTLNSLSILYREMNRMKDAEDLGLEAKKIWEEMFLSTEKDHPNLAYSYNNLGGLYSAIGKYMVAESYFLKAGKILDRNIPDYIQNSMGLARVYWNLGKVGKANELYNNVFNKQYEQLKKVFAFTNEYEKNLYLKNINGQGDEYYSFYFDNPGNTFAASAYNTSLLNRNLILSSIQGLRKSVFSSGDTVLINKFNQWTNYRRQLSSLYLSTDEAQLKQKKLLEERSEILEKELSRKTSFRSAGQSNTKWQHIKAALKPDEAAIEFVEFRYFNGKRWTDSTYYIALLLKKNSVAPVMIKLSEKKSLDSLWIKNAGAVNEFYSKRGADEDEDNIQYGNAFKLIWEPLEKHMGGVKKIYYSAAGLLHRVSFAALSMNNAQLLSDKYQLWEMSSTSSIVNKKDFHIDRSQKLKLYGGVKYDNNRGLSDDPLFDYLPGTEEEVMMIERDAKKANYKVVTFTGSAATEQSFKQSELDVPAVLHVATHGFFFSQINDSAILKKTKGARYKSSSDALLRSGLVFAGANHSWDDDVQQGAEDGIVTAYEVSNMYLPNTKLVVLSACETALGDVQGSEGVYGLQRAFKMAGVENLVMSLWQVPDTETAEFMNAFYKNIFRYRSVADAFYIAQTQMKKKYRNDPYKWAAWILVR